MSNANATTGGGVSTPISNVQSPQVAQTPQKKKQSSKAIQTDNHEVLSDAVAASGVNIRAEEEAMVTGLSISKRQIEQNTFLKPNQLHWFMNKTLEEQGIKPVTTDQEVSNLISASCEHYLTQILTDTIIMMRHRRHSSNVQKSNNRGGSKKFKNLKSSANSHSGLSSKSELSKALRDIASKHKDREEKRVRRRIFLGLEEEKLEEDLIQDHKQTNLTASLMMSGSKKKKYSWMQSSPSSSSAINFRGDNGIRYREAREEQAIVLRDLIAALENRRIGVSNALLKGYARLRD